MIIPDDREFAIVCTTGDYFLVAGNKQFVESVLGKSVHQARAEFEEFATNLTWEAERLTAVSRKYSGM